MVKVLSDMFCGLKSIRFHDSNPFHKVRKVHGDKVLHKYVGG